MYIYISVYIHVLKCISVFIYMYYMYIGVYINELHVYSCLFT